MDIDHLKIRALQHYKGGVFDRALSESFAAIFSATGLSWPYFLIARIYQERSNLALARSMFQIYLIRAKEDDPQEWKLQAEEFLNEG